MQAVLSSAFALSASHLWLVTANFILCVLLGMWMLRFRKLYYAARSEQSNTYELIENLSEGIYRSLPNGRQIKANKALVHLNGYNTEAEMLAAVRDIAGEWYVDPGRRDEFKRLLERDGMVVDFVSEIHRHKSRERIWITESARVVRDNNSGRPLYYEGSVREITETMKRLKLEEQFSNLIREIPGAVFQFTLTTNGPQTIDYVSPGFERVTGVSTADLKANWRNFINRVPESERLLYREGLGRNDVDPQPFDIEHRYVAPDGSEKWLRVSATPEVTASGVIWYGYMSDVTLRKNNQLAVERLAYFDTLTGLPNRRAFLDRIASEVTACRTGGRRGALLFIDLDNFKSLNDTRGHDVGDQYLVKVAQRLQQCVSHGDLVARIGGDEFVVLLAGAGRDEPTAARHAITVGNRLIAAMRQPFDLGNHNHRASASIGVVVFDGNGAPPEEILKRADIAMYEAKASGRDNLAFYDPRSMDREAERYRILADLRETLGRQGDELELHLQPLMDCEGQVVAAEALIRWNHPDLGRVMPDRFIPVAEQFGLISDIGEIVIARACNLLARWQRDPRFATLHLAINLSVQCLQNDSLVPYLKAMLAKNGVSGHRLTIEVTENVLARDQTAMGARMRELKALGVRLALDDFGTGYSSLTYLKALPFDEVKIDGSFVADIETTESDRALVKTMLAMAQTLGMVAVAERVETFQQEAFLRTHGCDRYQGWLYAKAMPEAGFAAFVTSLAKHEAPAAISA